jgi:O-antigen ligase
MFKADVKSKLMPVGILILSLLVVVIVNFWPLQQAAVALAALVLPVIFFYRPVWGLVALFFVLPVEGIMVSGRGATEFRLLGIAIFTIWVIRLLIFREKPLFNQTFWAAAAFVAWAGISFLWVKDMEVAGFRYGTLVQLIMLFLLTINVIENDRDFKLVLASLLVAGVGSTVLSLSLLGANIMERARTFEAQDPNAYGIIVGMGLIAGLYLATSLKNRWLRLASGFGSAYLAFPLLLAQSRSIWMAVTASLTVFLWHTKNRLRNLLVIGSVIIVTITAAFSLDYINPAMIRRTSELLTLASRGTTRFDIWKVGATIFLEHPVAGVGFLQFPRVYNRYRYSTHGIKSDLVLARDPHNIYLGVAAELGLIGLALLALIFWKAWRQERLPPGINPWINPAFLVFLLISSMGLNQIRIKAFWLVLALAVKAQELAGKKLKDKQDPE